jgi:hypothetical protein
MRCWLNDKGVFNVLSILLRVQLVLPVKNARLLVRVVSSVLNHNVCWRLL